MSQNSVQAASAFAAHIEKQERERQSCKERGEPYEPLPEERACRERLMQELLASLGLSKVELQSKLSIDRATWDRWRAMSSIPQRSHLDAITRFAAQHLRHSADEVLYVTPRPHEMLSARPRTLGRLRLVYGFFEWKNAVFVFKNPWHDSTTATEMALLALRGCSLIYIMSDPDSWRNKFTNSLVSVLGKNDAARALSRICIVGVSPDELADAPNNGFGIFNFEATNPDDCTGYVWNEHTKEADNTRPDDERDDCYDAFPASDSLVSDLREQFGARINKAFETIEQSPLPELWAPILSHETRAQLLEIAIVR